MKKSNASSDQPASEAKKAWRCLPVSIRKELSTVHSLCCGGDPQLRLRRKA
jgi:hypothetical protein